MCLFFKKTWVCGLLYLFFVYTPLIISGGFVVDDWGVAGHSLKYSGLLESLINWFPLWSNRPLAAVLLTFTGYLFGANSHLYMLANLTIWFLALYCFNYALKSLLSNTVRWIFAMIASAPIIATTPLFSPATQMTAIFSICLWSIALALDNLAFNKKARLYAILSHLCVFSAFLIYESILPLLLLSIGLRSFRAKKILSTDTKRLILIYTVIIFFIAVYQKFIISQFMPVYSRLSYTGIEDMLMAWFNWFLCIFVQAPMLIFGGIGYIYKLKLITIFELAALALFVFWIIFLHYKSDKNRPLNNQKIFLYLSISVFFCTSLLYVLSRSEATLIGYDNRGLFSTWFSLALTFSAAISIVRSRILLGMLGFFMLSICAIYILQRNERIEAVKLQNYIINDIKNLADQCFPLTNSEDILGLVPRYIPSNFNGQSVFTVPWDFGPMVYITSSKKFNSGAPVSSGMPPDELSIKDDSIFLYGGWWSHRCVDTWFYHYKPNGGSTLKKIVSTTEAASIVSLIRADNEFKTAIPVAQNYSPAASRTRIINWLMGRK